MLFSKRLAFIGAGNMAEALIQGILDASLLKKDEMIASDVTQSRATYVQEKTGVIVLAENAQTAKQAETIILAVKPQMMRAAIKEIAGVLSPEQLVISIAAGVKTNTIEGYLTQPLPVIRVMPNTPAMVGCSATAICKGKYANDDHLKWAIKIFEAVGFVVVVDEKLMDAVTALSGSGPAYIFTIIESLIDAGVELGLPRDIACGLTIQTVKGAAIMLEETQKHPAVLKNMVTSPGGTTAAGLHALEKNGLRVAILEAIIAAENRAKELG
ncbi:pyrroline-5-carboxylate reductase [Candidatus Desantisbacteria bacterium CG2_30_40_21]|uniref:Pyrroline-5-carboxylate reductase n=4 Tax=unclassified Candidatus Desantisiibacteriota TaxID=3106372 RepID=A0A2M7JDT8_9BACT|nr:MAG: pyrroline-5-carboxylate reductase [Candidatus Desantisbacteria bacterium CG2_30_40_21]PIP39992.1 MAG: pyrroline-5-carboxylate reductase [Candidatus Desantisbacteria bacterium CG23_combo_of_CG06-09_8_20_14_all_40_23]PIX17568.1 MAG: pyrroline-5-carboxylate reductase [Candidatus Desantisbacteria bacterium CG_4_8_14_3_um_filter_40_12]PJB28625.1 MAG: pyrroline-5-carboxylate reductase [Candidatus Desantisbacteria bacterium CG_4_9_14_3_um_filter_40_11]